MTGRLISFCLFLTFCILIAAGGSCQPVASEPIHTDAFTVTTKKLAIERNFAIKGKTEYSITVSVDGLELKHYLQEIPDLKAWQIVQKRSIKQNTVTLNPFEPDQVSVTENKNDAGTLIGYTISLNLGSHVSLLQNGDILVPEVKGIQRSIDPAVNPKDVLYQPSVGQQTTISVPSAFGLGFSPTFAPNEQMEDGAHHSALQILLKPHLDLDTEGQFYIESNNKLSSETGDTSSQLALGLGFQGRHHNNQYYNLLGYLGAVTSQSFNREALQFNLGVETDVLGQPLGLGHIASTSKRPLFRLYPINYEYRIKTISSLTSITNRDLYYASGEFQWSPIFLFASKDPDIHRDSSLSIDLKGYWFPDFQVSNGFTLHHLEGAASIRLLITPWWGKTRRDYTNWWLYVAYTTGVNDTQQFARSSSVSLGVSFTLGGSRPAVQFFGF